MPVQRAQRRYLGYVIATALAFGGSPAFAKPEEKNAKAAKPADTKPAVAKPAAAKPASAKAADPAKETAKPKQVAKPKQAKPASKAAREVGARAVAARPPSHGGGVGRTDGARQGDAVACRDPADNGLLAGHAGGRRHVESGRHRRARLHPAGTPRFASGRAARGH